jgi:predicted PurR-regulated permease PerM
METDAQRSGWRSSDVVRVTIIVLALLALFRFLWFARTIFLVVFLAVILGLVISRGVDFLERHRVRRGLGAAFIVFSSLALIAGGIALGAPSLKRQSSELRKALPALFDRVEKKVGADPMELAQQALSKSEPKNETAVTTAPPAAPPQEPRQEMEKKPAEKQKAERTSRLRESMSSEMGQLTKILFPFLSSTIAAIAGVIFLIFIALYIAADTSLYQRGLLLLFPPQKRERAAAIGAELADLLRGWLFARMLAMLIIGAVTTGALMIIGVPAALALGIIAGVLELIPLIGPITASIPAIGMALVESPMHALWTGVAFIVIQQLEGHVVTPLLMQKRIDTPAVVVIVSVASLGVIFGVIGMLVAEPLAGAVILLVKRLYVKEAPAPA